MEKPLVSIACISYNQEKFIKDTLDGFVMQQTNFPFEVVISDDCSKDGTRQIIAEYKNRYPNLIRDISPDQNKGAMSNYIYVHQNVEGKYVAFCEGDDYWTDSMKLQKQVDYMEAHPEIGLCYTDYNEQYGSSTDIKPSLFEQQHKYRPESYEQHLLRPGYVAPMTWIYRKEMCELLLNATYFTDGTYSFLLEVMKNSNVAYLPIVTATYRLHEGSASAPTNAKSLFNYMNGVFRTQRYFINKYPCSEELKNKVMMRGYLEVLPIAVTTDQDDFIKEAQAYMVSQDIDIHLIIRDLNQGEKRRRSKAYRIGKALLKPFDWIKNM